MSPTPEPGDRLWGLATTSPVTGILTALCGAAVALGAAFLGDYLGLPGPLLGAVLFVIFTAQAVVQVTRLTFTDTHLLRDRWIFVLLRRDSVPWDEIEALRLCRDEENESTSRWSLLLRSRAEPRSKVLDLLNAGTTAQRNRDGWWRTRHFDRHARLLAAFHAQGIPLIDSKDPNPAPTPNRQVRLYPFRVAPHRRKRRAPTHVPLTESALHRRQGPDRH